MLSHDAALTTTGVSFPGGGSVTHTIGSLHTPTTSTTEAANNTLLERWLGFTLQGQIDRHLEHTAKTGRWFEYDSLGQLRRARNRLRTPESIPGTCPNFHFGMSNTGGANCTPVLDYVTLDSVQFTYDAVGNRTDQGGSYTTGNRITGFDGCTYQTDADGNVVSRKGSAPCVPIDTLLWTPEGWLDSLTAGSTGIKFLYDAGGRLTAKRVNGTVQAWFLWDGAQLLAQLNGSASAVVTEYSYYGIDAPHAVIRQPAGTRFYARGDGLGSVIALTDESNAIQAGYQYDDWGNLLSHSDAAGFNGTDRARWKGALWLGPELDLYYMRNRWYEPHSGRFLSEDPIGLAGGINPVIFALNDPVNGADPEGLQTECFTFAGTWSASYCYGAFPWRFVEGPSNALPGGFGEHWRYRTAATPRGGKGGGGGIGRPKGGLGGGRGAPASTTARDVPACVASVGSFAFSLTLDLLGLGTAKAFLRSVSSTFSAVRAGSRLGPEVAAVIGGTISYRAGKRLAADGLESAWLQTPITVVTGAFGADMSLGGVFASMVPGVGTAMAFVSAVNKCLPRGDE